MWIAITPGGFLSWSLLLSQCYLCISFSSPPIFSSRYNIVSDTSFSLRITPRGDDLDKIIRQKDPKSIQESSSLISPTASVSRRDALFAAAAAAAWIPFAASAMPADKANALQDLELGRGEWTSLSATNNVVHEPPNSSNGFVSASFATYTARFLINYDSGVKSWWKDINLSFSLLSEEQRQTKLGKSFGCFATSVRLALEDYLQKNDRQHQQQPSQAYTQLARLLLEKYGRDENTKRQIGILFALLPDEQQPIEILTKLTSGQTTSEMSIAKGGKPPPIWTEDLGSLLPPEYYSANVKGSSTFTIYPPINLFEIGIDEEFGQTALATAFGPLSSVALTRDIPAYSFGTYARFGISGAAGCALTHSFVIPLDVVKTKIQTDPGQYTNIFDGARRIVEQEGLQGLLTGAQATLAGYIWYGVSVYPCYTFFKRFMTLDFLPPEIATVNAVAISLTAGALAAVVASLGLTPLEAARIRAVGNPDRYKPLGLMGTLGVIANEDAQLGWKAVYAGLPSLMTRQVIFGSVKFLAFERANEAIYTAWPFLRDATWTALAVSLVAGGFSGTLSSVVSQPADSVLTFVAQNSSGKGSLGVIEGCQMMVEEEGVGSLFRGLGSRCVWAGSIIAVSIMKQCNNVTAIRRHFSHYLDPPKRDNFCYTMFSAITSK
jgi:solute carrier family 25 phosphate transporter 3